MTADFTALTDNPGPEVARLGRATVAMAESYTCTTAHGQAMLGRLVAVEARLEDTEVAAHAAASTLWEAMRWFAEMMGWDVWELRVSLGIDPDTPPTTPAR